MGGSGGDTDTTQGHASYCPAECMPADDDRGNCSFLMSAYILAGLAMMLNIRLSYSSAPYALIRFRLPENLFSVFVRRMASSLELWCLPGFIIADAMELAIKLVIKEKGNNNFASKELKFHAIILPSIVAQWLNFLTYVILFFVYMAGDDQGHLTTFYWTIAVSGFVFGINNVFVFAADYNYIPIYIAGENCFPALTSFIHYITTLIFGNRRKWDSDFIIVFIDILVAIIISLAAAIVWTWAYGICTDAGPFNGTITYTTTKDIKSIIIIYTPTTNTSTTEAPININGQVKIKTGPRGNCKDATTVDLTATQATITPQDKTATLTININTLTNADTTKHADLENLAALATPLDCTVTVNPGKKTLTIKSGTVKYGDDKCIEITLEITLTGTDTLANLGLTSTTKCSVKVDPPPNHLTIKYTTTGGDEKNISGAVAPPKDTADSMTDITEKIAEGLNGTAEDPDDKTYYNVPLHKTNIHYYFKLDKGQASKLNAGAIASIIVQYGHIFAEGFSGTNANPYMISPLLIVLVGMGLVYAIYPGIAPGMIVPFYLIDKIEMVLLIATIFPPVIIALLQKYAPNWSPKTKFVFHSFDKMGMGGWTEYNEHVPKGPTDFSCANEEPVVHAWIWHIFDLLIVLMIILAYLFIYSLHYRESNISRSIVNQPKMSTALTIIFYMCHEISLAVGFPGMVANAAEYTVIAQMIGAFLMVFLALYSEGYIIEYKSHDPKHWRSEGMWYLYGYYQLNPDFFIMIKFNVCSDGYCDFK